VFSVYGHRFLPVSKIHRGEFFGGGEHTVTLTLHISGSSMVEGIRIYLARSEHGAHLISPEQETSSRALLNAREE
jgi:hypothetical protein